MAYYQDEPFSPSCDVAGAPRLLLDAMLGRLAKWLRLIGYDAAYENATEDRELARRAREEGRVLLTRDRQLAGRRGLRALLIESQSIEAQVQQVLEALPIAPCARKPRCSVCNGQLTAAEPSELVEQVPAYVLRHHTDFRRCSDCGRVYWSGTHFGGIRDCLAQYGIVESADRE